MEKTDLMEALIQTGLTSTEAKVYLVMLKGGPSLASEITKKAGLHRRTVYDVMPRLLEKGIISTMLKNNRNVYEAASPQKMMELLKQKESALEESLTELTRIYSAQLKKEKTRFFQGRNGLKTVLEEQISEGKPVHVLLAYPGADEILKYHFKWYNRERKRAKIPMRLIFDSSARGRHEKIPLAQVRYISGYESSPAATNIYGDKVAIILWSAENPFAIVIENKDIADNYRKFFEILWKKARK
ncbi:MAG: hypothetical protein HYW25_04610 [Candidatus Aenigmarchaeota archaeon]|nr:hypothetical protein [Candidatus Aenigmarchaeota archaeon]